MKIVNFLILLLFLNIKSSEIVQPSYIQRVLFTFKTLSELNNYYETLGSNNKYKELGIYTYQKIEPNFLLTLTYKEKYIRSQIRELLKHFMKDFNILNKLEFITQDSKDEEFVNRKIDKLEFVFFDKNNLEQFSDNFKNHFQILWNIDDSLIFTCYLQEEYTKTEILEKLFEKTNQDLLLTLSHIFIYYTNKDIEYYYSLNDLLNIKAK